MAEPSPKPARWYLPNRRWLTFSLRGLLLVTFLISLPFAWLGMQLADKRAERNLYEDFVSQGGRLGNARSNSSTEAQSRLLARLGEALGEKYLYEDFCFAELGPTTPSDQVVPLLRRVTRRYRNMVTLILDDTELTDADLRFARGLSQLQILHLEANPIGDTALDHVVGLSNLESVRLNFTEVTDAGLDRLVQLPKLESLRVKGCRVSAEGVAKFRAARPDVRVEWAPWLGDEATAAARVLRRRGWRVWLADQTGPGPPVVHVSPPDEQGLPTRDDLELVLGFLRLAVRVPRFQEPACSAAMLGHAQVEEYEGHNLTDDQLTRLASSKRLRALSIWTTSVSDAGWKSLAELPNLQDVTLREVQSAGPCLAALGSAKELRKLTFSGDDLSGDLFGPLAGLEHLEELDLSGVSLAEPGYGPLASLTRLARLNLYTSDIDDAGVAHLARLPNLKWLDIGYTPVSDEGLLALASVASLEELVCNSMSLSPTHITPEGLARFEKLRPDVKIFEPVCPWGY